MENQIRETSRVVGMDGTLVRVPRLLSVAVEVAAVARQCALPFPAQIPFFALHLASLECGQTIDCGLVQKKSLLAPRDYHRSLGLLGQMFETRVRPIVTSRSIGGYYGCPSLASLIDAVLLTTAPHDRAVTAVTAVASAFQVAATVDPKLRLGTLAEVAQLWAQTTESLRTAIAAVKPHVEKLLDGRRTALGRQFAQELDDARLLLNSIDSDNQKQSGPEEQQTQSKRGRSISVGQSDTARNDPAREDTRRVTSRSPPPGDINRHPLRQFCCASPGAAFGPLFLSASG